MSRTKHDQSGKKKHQPNFLNMLPQVQPYDASIYLLRNLQVLTVARLRNWAITFQTFKNLQHFLLLQLILNIIFYRSKVQISGHTAQFVLQVVLLIVRVSLTFKKIKLLRFQNCILLRFAIFFFFKSLKRIRFFGTGSKFCILQELRKTFAFLKLCQILILKKDKFGKKNTRKNEPT